jgi:hypothetical protein
MVNEATSHTDRPAPGHYQRRLSAVLSRNPPGSFTQDRQPAMRAHSGTSAVRNRRRGGRQMPLPLEPT